MKVIYLDNNATTQCSPAVVEAMLPYFSEKYGNASSMHTFGGNNRHVIDQARQQVASLIGAAHADEIIFTSCATESDNTAIFSAVRSYPKKKHIITSAVEHPAIMEPYKYLEAQGYRVDFIGVDEYGRFDMQRFQSVLDEDTALVSVMWANSETGTIFPIAEIARLTHQKGALFHTDAVQAVGKIPVNVQEMDIDMLSLSAHKFHGPKGVGALYVRRGTRFMPYLMGGHQEKHRRAGTENVPYIVGLGKAAELAQKRLTDGTSARIAALRDELEQGIVATIADVKVNGDPEHRVPNTTNISFGYIEGESILMYLNDLGVCASSGSACTSGSLEPSHVLRAMGVPFQFAHGSIRFSLSDQTTREDIELVLKELPPIIERLRKISPFSRLAA
ncbi:cysteine desulfurase NifS [Candidatus Avelusimicrobium gallicola]|uniref:Cysteine desulfurase n=1 Tax=Candidatus Avelusimicrobium gallicola TaxID=2562704 RepID=A0A1Y4DQ87_9BACT|nr:cysteine desulfurase NifS [Elusimicrobium sp. An273]OUO57521.1 cysteine desulfurase NifS [Elusimicrobium sp. An273]